MDLVAKEAHERARALARRIEPGMLADVIVVEQNPFEVPITRVHETRVRLSFVGGRNAYDATPGTTDLSFPR